MDITKFYPNLDEFLMSLDVVSKDYKEEWNWTRYMVDKKMFLAVCGEGYDNPFVTVKCETDFNVQIRSMFPDIITEGYYMNKVHWNSIYPTKGDVPYELVKEMALRGYNLILGSLSKKRQKEIKGE